MLILTAFLTPLVEFFDHWDPPGPGNDTELAVFGLILVLCLVLLVCKVIPSLIRLIGLTLSSCPQQSDRVPSQQLRHSVGLITPHSSPPLRI
jgi:hypothetical protein